MSEMHEANRRYWDAAAPDWQKRDEENWRRCVKEPSTAFEGKSLDFIQEFTGGLRGKRVCVIASGDNYASFALAGLGADVTSTDISQPRLDIAKRRARTLKLDIDFIRCDAAGLEPLPTSQFDLVVSTNGFFVWISDLSAVFASVNRVLKPGAFYVFYDIHPFQRPWKNQVSLQMERPYWETGPFVDREPGRDLDEYHFFWTLGDIINSLVGGGLNIRRLAESSAINSRFWSGVSYGSGADESLQDWHNNPRAGLPVWLTIAAQKSSDFVT